MHILPLNHMGFQTLISFIASFSVFNLLAVGINGCIKILYINTNRKLQIDMRSNIFKIILPDLININLTNIYNYWVAYLSNTELFQRLN